MEDERRRPAAESGERFRDQVSGIFPPRIRCRQACAILRLTYHRAFAGVKQNCRGARMKSRQRSADHLPDPSADNTVFTLCAGNSEFCKPALTTRIRTSTQARATVRATARRLHEAAPRSPSPPLRLFRNTYGCGGAARPHRGRSAHEKPHRQPASCRCRWGCMRRW